MSQEKKGLEKSSSSDLNEEKTSLVNNKKNVLKNLLVKKGDYSIHILVENVMNLVMCDNR